MPELFELIENGDTEAVRAALEQNPRLAVEEDGTNQLIHSAARQGELEIVKLLLQHGARVNGRDEDDRTPLHHAADSEVEVVRFLLQNGADPNVVDRFGYTPLVWSILECQPEGEQIGQILRDFGADYDLTAAAGRGDLERIRTILAENPGAIWQVPSAEILLGMCWALCDGDTVAVQMEIISLLFDSGLELNQAVILQQADDCGIEKLAALLRARAAEQAR